MCYQTKLTKAASEVEHRFNAKIENLNLFEPSEEISAFTFPKTPVITHLRQNNIEFFNWGLIPSWAKDTSIKKYTLNARIETIGQKPSFKENIHNRCLIIVNGFYEWQWLDDKGRKKQKYEIGLEGDALFAFAGLWSEWQDKKTYTIVTTEAQGIMKEIHNSKKRMPVILHEKNEKHWLSNASVDEFYQVDLPLVAKKIPPDDSKESQFNLFH
ncbi:MAG: SOS response-associated peptidase [Flavobacteriaceae bacterium]|nr:SOS response-associated peptidase [Flavobacteriaceae bacterium]